MAFVVPATGTPVDPDELIAWSRENMANYKVPRYVELVDALPLNARRQGAQVRAGRARSAPRGGASVSERPMMPAQASG